MRYVGEITMTYGVLRRASLAAVGLRTFMPFVIVALAGGSYGAYRGGPAAGLIAAGIAVLAFAYGAIEWRIWRGWRRLRGVAATPWRYEVGDPLVVATPQGRSEMPLSTFSGVRVARSAWILSMEGTKTRVVVPRAAFTEEEALAIDEFFARDGIF